MRHQCTTLTPIARFGRSRFFGPVVLALLLLGACASMPPPTADIQAADQAIANAEGAGAQIYAAADLDEARNKLASANNAVADEQMSSAQRLAREAQVSAALAAAKSGMAQTRDENETIRKSLEILKQEMQHNEDSGS